MSWEREEIIGLSIILIVIVGLTIFGLLTSQAVDGIKYVGSAFMISKGASNLLPGAKP